jgi:hypothetical protein
MPARALPFDKMSAQFPINRKKDQARSLRPKLIAARAGCHKPTYANLETRRARRVLHIAPYATFDFPALARKKHKIIGVRSHLNC